MSEWINAVRHTAWWGRTAWEDAVLPVIHIEGKDGTAKQALIIGGKKEVVGVLAAVEPHGKGWDMQPVVFFHHFPSEV